MDAADMFENISDEMASPINPHVAHLVEQAIPTVAFNPHIYEDVLDIIHIKTGLSPYGTEKIGANSGLRNPDKIDEYLASEIKLLLQSFGLEATMNKRFGFFEISVNDMNKFITRDPDATLVSAALAQEQYLQAREENDPVLEKARWWERVKPTEYDEKDVIAHDLATQVGLKNPGFYEMQSLKTIQFDTPDGTPLPAEEMAKVAYTFNYQYDDARVKMAHIDGLRKGMPDLDIGVPDSLKNSPTISKM